MKRKQLMQFHIEGEGVRCIGAPALDHSRIRNGIEGRVDLNHLEMLRIPAKPLGRTHFLRIPTLDETGVGPAGCANKNFADLFFRRVLPRHSSTKSRQRRTQIRLPVPRVKGYLKPFSICAGSTSHYSENAGW